MVVRVAHVLVPMLLYCLLLPVYRLCIDCVLPMQHLRIDCVSPVQYLCSTCAVPVHNAASPVQPLCILLPYLCTVWEVSHCGEKGVFWVEDAGLAHVPDLETRDQAGYQDTRLAS